MENIFKELEKIIDKELENKNINSIIHNDTFLFMYNDISGMENICKIYKKIKKLYEDSKKWISKNVCNVEKIKEKIRGNFVECNVKSSIYSDLFLEIESIIAYTLVVFKPKKELAFQFQEIYHSYKALFIYLCSSFDTIASLLYFHFCDKEELTESKLRDVYFKKKETYLEHKNSSVNQKLVSEIDKIINSKSFQYINMTRNFSYHIMEQPLLKYNYSINIMICFIVLTTLIMIIQENMN